MRKYLRYDGYDIRLHERTEIAAWTRAIDAAAAATGSGWLPVEDIDGVVHRIRVSPGIAIRLVELPEPPAPPAPLGVDTRGLSDEEKFDTLGQF